MNYEVFNASGRLCCESDDITHLCDTCKATVAARLRIPPDPYERDLAALRAASQTPKQHDNENRLRSMAAFRESFYETHFTMSSAADNPATSGYLRQAPPDPYERGLEELRRTRR